MTQRVKSDASRKFGLSFVGDVPWGTHLCQFYETKQDLIAILVPYLAEGLRNNEFCMWVTSPPLEVEEAKTALRKTVPDLDEYISKGQIEILPYTEWYLLGGKFDTDRVMQGWVEKEKAALSRGFEGLRLTGNTFWIERSLWKNFTDYEATINEAIVSRRMLAVCTYSLSKCSGNDVIDVVRNHVGTLVKRSSGWVMVEDSWQRKQAETALQESDRRWATTLSSIGDGVIATDLDGKVTFMNRVAEELTGWTLKDASQRPLREVFNIINEQNRREVEDPVAKVLEKGCIIGLADHTILVRKDGTEVAIDDSGAPIKDENGKVTGVVLVFRDITERKRTEQALRDSQVDLNRAQAVAKTGSWRLDTRQNILLWSDETYRMFGVPKGTPLTYETFLGAIHLEDRGYVDAKWNAALHGEPYDIEHRIVVNGEVKWVRERAELEFDNNGTLLGGFGTVEEITELKEMQAKLEEYSRHLEDLVEEKTRQLKDAERLAAIGETAGMIGHDIRNPLQAIIGELYLSKDYLHSLPEGEAKQELADSMRVIEEQTIYINKIVTDLQDYAKPLAPCIENADLEKIVESVLSTVDMPENIKVSCLIEKDFPNLLIDRSYMKRILTNLTVNAVQAMSNGGKLTITAYCREHRAFVNVEDTGEGIPEEAKSKLFKPLFTTKSKGQGFGLAVVKKLANALNGTITFESEEGKGTKFIIEFPKNSYIHRKSDSA